MSVNVYIYIKKHNKTKHMYIKTGDGEIPRSGHYPSILFSAEFNSLPQ